MNELGWKSIRQTGSHDIYQHLDHPHLIAVPIYDVVKKGVVKSIIRDTGLIQEEFFRRL